ncbi:MAG: hydrogenase maturation nickel metallochaperone HypA [Chloroflexota bacterium]
MHELSIAASVVDIVCRHAEGRRVKTVTLTVGRLRQVVPSALTFSFELVAQGTVAEGAVLEIEPVIVHAVCNACTARSELHAFPFACKQCNGFNLKIVAGDELRVKSIDMEDDIGVDGPRVADHEGDAGSKRRPAQRSTA